MRVRSIVSAFAGISLYLIFQTGCTGRTASEEIIPEKARNLAAATEFINERCPEQVDPETRMDSVTLSREGELVFFYTLPNKEKSGINPESFTAYMLGAIVKNVRTNRDLKMHRDSSVVMKFNYRDRNGELITDFSLSPERYR